MDGRESAWVSLAYCIWEGPACLISRCPLKARMKSFLAEFPSLSNFFVDILEIPDCYYSDIIRELDYLSGKEDLKLEIASSLYRQLWAMCKSFPAKTQENIK